MLKNQSYEVHGRQGHELLCSGKQGVKNLMMNQIVVIRNEKAYVLTFTAELDAYEAFKELGSEIFSSFKLL
ncbi:MAG: hypothetical protein ACI959_000509 [Limisphaerales bacterium]|jgi:hypothetical protein